jgi:hypothetical protein
MRKTIAAGAAGFLVLVAANDAMSAGGGPWDRWRSPYALIAPQSFPSTSENQVFEAGQGDRAPNRVESRHESHSAKKRPARRPAKSSVLVSMHA